MAKKRYRPEEILIKIRQVDLLQSLVIDKVPVPSKGPSFNT